MLHRRSVLVVPDFIANAGGVICASVEFRGGVESTALQAIAQKIRENTRAVLTHARDANIQPRQAAETLARERIKRAMSFRRQ
jgi:glutamate dehydrogenase/leucine dehydrogenase